MVGQLDEQADMGALGVRLACMDSCRELPGHGYLTILAEHRRGHLPLSDGCHALEETCVRRCCPGLGAGLAERGMGHVPLWCFAARQTFGSNGRKGQQKKARLWGSVRACMMQLPAPAGTTIIGTG